MFDHLNVVATAVFVFFFGLVSALGRGFDLYAEGVPLGERGMTVGGGKSF